MTSPSKTDDVKIGRHMKGWTLCQKKTLIRTQERSWFRQFLPVLGLDVRLKLSLYEDEPMLP